MIPKILSYDTIDLKITQFLREISNHFQSQRYEKK